MPKAGSCHCGYVPRCMWVACIDGQMEVVAGKALTNGTLASDMLVGPSLGSTYPANDPLANNVLASGPLLDDVLVIHVLANDSQEQVVLGDESKPFLYHRYKRNCV